MRLEALALILAAFIPALPGYRYQFPADHFNHPNFQTEWWYYTGNLRDEAGHRFGFELTFFRQAVKLPQSAVDSSGHVWRPDQLYLAHLALTDIDNRKFVHFERLNRGGPGIAGIAIDSHKYWNGNWSVQWEGARQKLEAVSDEFTLSLTLASNKPPIVHGKDGVSQKGPSAGEASHYISLTRLAAQGALTFAGKTSKINGTAWMDHEFFTQAPNPMLAGWDWFAIQLSNNEELMLYRLRDKSGVISPYSSGTYIDPAGVSHNLTAAQISLIPGRQWHKYPVEWQISVPSLDLELTELPSLDDQELSTPASPSPSYWEGAVTYAGKIHGKPTTGLGYLEMTGYSQPIRLGH